MIHYNIQITVQDDFIDFFMTTLLIIILILVFLILLIYWIRLQRDYKTSENVWALVEFNWCITQIHQGFAYFRCWEIKDTINEDISLKVPYISEVFLIKIFKFSISVILGILKTLKEYHADIPKSKVINKYLEFKAKMEESNE